VVQHQQVVSDKLLVVKLSDFQGDGAGKLIGPNGNEMDTEEFLSSLQIWETVILRLNTTLTLLLKNMVKVSYSMEVWVTEQLLTGQGFPGGKYDDICNC
jgi:hypothetical protein